MNCFKLVDNQSGCIYTLFGFVLLGLINIFICFLGMTLNFIPGVTILFWNFGKCVGTSLFPKTAEVGGFVA